MRKGNLWALLLALVMLMTTPGAYAEESFSMAGYDDEATGHVWTENRFFERMKALTGVELDLEQYTTADAWANAKKQMLAGEKNLPDVLFKANLSPQELQEWYAAGKLHDLRDYIAEDSNLRALLDAHPEWVQAISMPDGAIVALPYIDELQFNNGLWINQQWLRRFGLEMPTTAEELTDVLRVFRDNDANGNGKRNDEVPLTFSSLWDLRFLLHAFGVNANDYYVTMDENGTVSEILTSDANREFLTWLHQLWEEKLLDRYGFTGMRSMGAKPEEGTDVIYGVMFASSPVDVVHVSKVEQYELLEPLWYNNAQVYRDLTGDLVRGTFAITTACEDPAAMMRWVDHLYCEEGFILAACGEADEEFEYIEGPDGPWMWTDAGETLTKVTLPQGTLHGDASMPGWASVDFQKRLDESATQHILTELEKLRAIDSMPYPMVWLTAAQQQRMNELALNIALYAEQQMVWFVAGDVELNDKTWNEFCQTVKALGVDEMVSIWQAAADARLPIEQAVLPAPASANEP